MRYTNVVCSDCGLVYLTPRPSAEHFAAFYVELYPELYGKSSIASAADERGRAVFDFLDAELGFEAASGVLDIGCGDGALLLAVADGLHERCLPTVALAGCEPGWPPAAPDELPHPRGAVPVYRSPVEQLGGLSAYSVYLMYDVIEHLLHPHAFCSALHDLASEGATLFVSTSCLDNWSAVPPVGWDSYYLRLAHTFTFSRSTLELLLASAGWQVTAWRAAPRATSGCSR